MTALDDRPAASPAFDLDLSAQRGELLARQLNETEAYDSGFADGYEAGLRAAHVEMAEWWARLAAAVRANSERLRGTVPEPGSRSNGSPDDSIWFTAPEWATWAGGR